MGLARNKRFSGSAAFRSLLLNAIAALPSRPDVQTSPATAQSRPSTADAEAPVPSKFSRSRRRLAAILGARASNPA